jgi:F0F1-type ATP synthase assembly protein I
MMDPDRAKLQIAAVFGAVFGILTGYVVGHPPFGILIWGLIGAVVGAGAVYCYRAFR